MITEQIGAAPQWTPADEAMRWLNEVDMVQGGANGPTIKLRAAVLELAALQSDLISCRGTVKTEMHHYERLAAVCSTTASGPAYEAEAWRLALLLGRIDDLMGLNTTPAK